MDGGGLVPSYWSASAAHELTLLGYSELPRPVDVRAVLDRHNIDSAPLVGDAVDQPVVATA